MFGTQIASVLKTISIFCHKTILFLFQFSGSLTFQFLPFSIHLNLNKGTFHLSDRPNVRPFVYNKFIFLVHLSGQLDLFLWGCSNNSYQLVQSFQSSIYHVFKKGKKKNLVELKEDKKRKNK